MKIKNILYLLLSTCTIAPYILAMEKQQKLREQILPIWESEKSHLNKLPAELITRIIKEDIPQIEADHTALLDAAKWGKVDQIEELLKKPYINIDSRDSDGNTPLMVAIRRFFGITKIEAVKLLLNAGANPNIQNKDKDTPLIYAVEYNYPEIVQMLIDHGANPNTANKNRDTALALATKGNNLEIIEILLSRIWESGKSHLSKLPTELIKKIIGDIGQINADHLALFKVILYNNCSKLKELLREPYIDIDSKDYYGNTPLIIAIDHFRIGVIKLLLNAGANPDLHNKRKESALIIAATNNKPEIVTLLLNHGADKNIQNVGRETALIIAVKNNHLEIIKILLDAGVDPNIQNYLGETALILAAKNNKLEILEMLLKIPIDRNIQDRNNMGALEWALYNNNVKIIDLLKEDLSRRDLSALKLLTEARTMGSGILMNINLLSDYPDIINVQDSQGCTSLMLAVRQDNIKLVKILFEKGADPDMQNHEADTALLHTNVNSSPEIVKILLDNGANPNIRGHRGKTALLWHTIWCSSAIVKILLEQGADPDIHDDQGNTPLIWATQRNNTKLLKILLENGANINIKNHDGMTALDLALYGTQSCNNQAIVDLLKKATEKVNSYISTNGCTSLISAAKNNNLEMVQMLLNAGADKDIQDKDGWTALHWAAKNNSTYIIQRLLKKNANLDIQDNLGCTALIQAVRFNRSEIAQMLLDKGANPNIKTRNGWTVLHWAASSGNLKIVHMLLNKGADLNIQDNKGHTAFNWAVKNKNQEIINLLIKAQKRADSTFSDIGSSGS